MGDEKNEDSAVRQIKRLNRATKEQCVRLIQMAGLTLGMCMQLKGCVQATVDNFDDNDSNGSTYDGPNDVQTVLWTILDFAVNGLMVTIYYVFTTAWWIFFVMVQTAGVATIACGVFFMLGGPMIWMHFQCLRGFFIRNAPWLMGVRSSWFIAPSLRLMVAAEM